MGGFDDQVFGGVDKSALPLGIIAPKNKNEVLLGFGEAMDDGVGKEFPTLILMGTSLMGPDGEGGVEQKDALLRPRFEVAGAGHVFTQVGFYFFVNVLE